MERCSSPRRRNLCKEGREGGHETSDNSLMCPKSALFLRVLYLRVQGADPYQNLATFKRGFCWVNITPIDISRTLNDTVRFLGPSLVFAPKDVSARYFLAAVAMALLFSGVETNIIKLVGCWRSDEMIRYLRMQADTLVRNFANIMVQSVIFFLHLNYEVPGLVPCY